MLKKKHRLLKETKFNKRPFFVCPIFILKITKNEKAFSRFGFIVSKKIEKRATARNRVKRQIRNCIETDLDKIKPGYDMLFLLKKDILNKSTKEISEATLEELKKQNLLK
jgi:ribonuclease P protein component